MGIDKRFLKTSWLEQEYNFDRLSLYSNSVYCLETNNVTINLINKSELS